LRVLRLRVLRFRVLAGRNGKMEFKITEEEAREIARFEEEVGCNLNVVLGAEEDRRESLGAFMARQIWVMVSELRSFDPPKSPLVRGTLRLNFGSDV
jgi:hypothetical protein